MKKVLLGAGMLAGVLAWMPAGAEVIQPRGGVTVIKTAAGEVTMLHSIINNNNAHDVQMLAFFKPSVDGPAEHIAFDTEQRLEPHLSMRTGADCMVSSARVFRDGGRLRVLYAERKGNWIDKKPVSLQLYELTASDDGAPGIPPLHFRLKKKGETKALYCDVNEALDAEWARFLHGVR